MAVQFGHNIHAVNAEANGVARSQCLPEMQYENTGIAVINYVIMYIKMKKYY